MNHQEFLNHPDTEFENEKCKHLELPDHRFIANDFINCTFDECNFYQSTFDECTFQHCNFNNCNLSLVKIPRCQFNEIGFNHSKIIGIDWTTVNWKKSLYKKSFPLEFVGCIINYSIFAGINLTRLKFMNCTAKEVYFDDANLSYADFNGTDLTDSVFRNTNLIGADFSKAKNYSIDVTINKIGKAKFAFPEALSLIYTLDIDIV